jgi:SAM-dependent methyltransferase
MERDVEIYFEIYFEKYNTFELISLCSNPIKNYILDLGSLPILEIGIGCGSDSLCLASMGKHVVCIEKEEKIIRQLNSRIQNYKNKDEFKLKIDILKQEFPNITLPFPEYSCIIISNLLHFYDYDFVKNSVDKIKGIVKINGLIYLKAHSIHHPFNKKPERYPAFKHFFNENEVTSLFPSSEFEIVSALTTTNYPSDVEKEIKNEWLRRYWEEFYSGKSNIGFEQFKQGNPIDDPEISVEIIVRKRKGKVP